MIDVQHGEQPLKRVAARRTRESTLEPADTDAAEDDNAGTVLYAPHQTSLYIAPPVINGQIPKNVYGNLDIYVPSMVPPGGAHIPHPETARAARIVGVDYADAVTGFSFKGRHGTAITSGAVVAAEYREAVEIIIEAFEDERSQAEAEKRSLVALRTWKTFLAGLRIRKRIEGYDIEGERDTAMKYETEKAENEDYDEGGGFVPDRDADGPAQPTAKTIPTRRLPRLVNDDEGGGFFAGEDEQEETVPLHTSDRFMNRVDDDKDDDGGFLLDRDDEDAEQATRVIDEENHEDMYHEESGKSADQLSAENDGQDILNDGGGFLPDDDDKKDENPPTEDAIELFDPESSMLDNHSSINPRNTAQNKEMFEEAFPDLPTGEMEENRMLHQLYESQESEHIPTISNEDVPASAPSKSSSSPLMRETTAGSEWGASALPSEAYSNNEPVAAEISEPDSSDEDKGSLLSHDPDDEDADPEWLA